MKKHTLMSVLCGALCFVLLTAATALAQPGSPTPAIPGADPDPTAVPINGTLSLLLAAGGAYGLKCLRQRRA